MKKIYLSVLFLFAALITFSQNPLLVKDIYPGITTSGIQQIVKTSNYTFFNAEDDDADADRGLYRTDGTAAGTIKLNLSSGVSPNGFLSTKAEKLTPLGNKIIFAGDNFTNYGEIWVSDGTQAGTFGLERFQPTTPNKIPVVELSAMGSYAYYSVVDGSNHAILKKTDGTPGGTSLVFDFNTVFASAPQVVLFKELNNVLYFIVYDAGGTGFDHLWRTDGTTAGTYELKNFGATQYVASNLMAAGNNLYLMIVTPGTGNVLWKTDGTVAGTVAVKTIGTTGNNNYPQNAAIGSTMYFSGLDANGMELWKTDGTAAGTVLVSDINPGSAGSSPNTLTVLNNNLYFNATTAAEGSELWKFDGVNASLVKDINPGTAGSIPGFLVVSNNTILFRASTPANGSELWITDGTSQNTLQVSDINPGVNGSGITLLTPGNPVYFTAGNGVNGIELYKYNNATGIDLRKIFVNDNNTSGDVYTTATGNNSNPGSRSAPVATIAYAISIAQAGDTIVVDAGMYPENITINKSLTIRGTKTGICPGALLTRGNESILIPPTTNLLAGSVITITAADVKLDGLTLDGDNPTLTSNYNMNGADVDGFSAITNNTASAANMQVVNCIIKNFNRNGIGMSNNVSGINISCNHIDNFARIVGTQGIQSDARAINMFGNNYGTISNNHLTRVSTGVIISSATTAAGSTPVLSNNIISSYTTGILFQAFSGTATPYEVTGNTITTADYASWNVTGQTNPVTNANLGFRLSGTTFNNTSNVTNNNISGCYFGMYVNGVTCVSGALNFTNNNISNSNNGMNIYQVTAPGNINISGGNISGSEVGVFYTAGSTTNAKLFMDGVSLSNNAVGIDASYTFGSTLPLQFNNTTISGGATGLRLYGDVSVPAGVLGGIAFSGQSTNYIQLTNYSFQGQVIDGTSLTFEGLTGSAMTLAQRFAAEDKIIHQVDYDGGGFIRIKSGEVFVTPQSYIGTYPVSWGTPTTVASVQRGISSAVTNDIVNIAAGTYTGQFTIDKALTLKGEGVGQTIISRGSAGALVPLPGLNEMGIIQSTVINGNIIISDLTVDGSNGTSSIGGPHHAIMLQSAGAIRNCEITNMQIAGTGSPEGNGIFVNYNGTDPRTMEIVNNNIHGIYWVGINAQGNNLSTTIANNNIDATGAIYGMGIIAGGGTPLPVLNIINNDIKEYNGFGMSIGSTNGIVNNNSLVGSGSAINTQGASVNATCNWFGSTDPAVINSKISGPMNHSPWLTSGTDTDAAIGFQPMANVCNGRQNKFYVNDNSQVGDVFTTAVGSPSNNGYPSAPLPSIPYAYGRIQAGDTIFVDAGTYDQAGVVYALSKGVTILGTNYNVSPNDASNKLLASATRNAESILTNGIFVIAANDISIKGFTLDLGDHRAIELQNSTGTNNNFGNFLYEKNIHKINTVGNFNQFPITGKLVSLPSLPVTAGFTFSDNRFEKSGTVGGTTFALNYVKDVTVTGNAFVVTGTTFKTQAIANLGNTGIVDNYNFQNNAADGAGVVANCIRVSSGVISQNILNNCDRGINVQGSMLQSSSLEFNNNTLIQTTGGTPFLGYNRAGSSNAAHTTIFKVQNNIISGTRVEGLANQFFGAMNFTINNSEKNPAFTISGNQIIFSGDYSSVGASEVRPITVRGNVANLTMASNEIKFINSGTLGAAVGLPSNPAITINTDFNLGAYISSNAVLNILNNKVQGFKQSIVFYDGVNVGRDAYVGYGNIPIGATININNNSFTGDSISINNGEVGEMINANCNWYGFTESHNVSPKVTETTVNHAPWLTNGTDTDVATGFQPMADVCNGVPVDADIITVTNVTCNGAANGSIDALVEEGLAPFTYAWSKDGVAGFSTSEDLTNLAPGEYKLIVTDANGSVDSVFATITEPDVLTASGSGTNNICFGETLGTADVSVGGGTLPYTYLWSNGETTENITDLAAGIYSVTVTDANGCTAVASYEVTHPTQVTASVTGSSSSCANTATVTAAGGTGSYSYLWSNGATTASITSVPSGTYTVTVTDANGCTAVANITLTANEAFNPSAQSTDVTCYDGNNGSITVTNVNAVAPFTYSIDGLQFQSSATFNNLRARTYTVTVVDANGCTGFITKTIAQPPQLTAVLNNVQSTCFGASTGAINITATGGTGGVSYAWTGPGYTSAQRNISGLAAGSYTLTVTDNNGCTAQLPAVVPTYNVITVDTVVTNIACKGEINGSIALTVTGGTGSGFSYSWNTGATTRNITNLGVGNYNVTITDVGSGCVAQRSFTITQPATIIGLSFTKTNATGCNTLGTITGSGTGGTTPYQYKLNNGNYQTSGLFTGLYAGNYTLTVMDAKGCLRSSAIISITDNGGDQYESNNSKNQAAADTIGKVVNARIALSTDIADWFKFTTPAGSRNYTVTLTHPSVNYTFNVYAAGNNTPPLLPVSSATGSKTYFLNGNAVYYISITGVTLSYNCYTLVVNPTALPIARTSATDEITPAPRVEFSKTVEVSQQLSASVYPNPHNGIFNLLIKSPENGMANIELFNDNGQKVIVRNVAVKAGDNIVIFNNIRQSLLLYKVVIGKSFVSGKVIGPN